MKFRITLSLYTKIKLEIFKWFWRMCESIVFWFMNMEHLPIYPSLLQIAHLLIILSTCFNSFWGLVSEINFMILILVCFMLRYRKHLIVYEASLLAIPFGSLDCSILILYFAGNIHLWENTYSVYLSQSVLSLSGWFFSSSIHFPSNFLVSCF